MAGRPASYKEFRKRIKGMEWGNYFVYDPKQRKVIDLGTEDAISAREKVVSLQDIPDTVVSPVQESIPVESNIESVSGKPSVDILEEWSKATTTPGNPPEPTISDKPNPPAKPITAAPVPPKQTAIVVKTPTKGLTPEQNLKLGRAIGKMAVQINTMVLAVGVKWAGRNPAELDEDDTAVLQLGWEMWLEELFVKNKPEPWMLVIGGNLIVAFAMYVNGEKIEKKSRNPNVDPITVNTGG